MTNNKSNACSNVAGYANPVRIYAGSSVTISGLGMSTVVFYDATPYSSAGLTGLTKGLADISGITVSVDGNIVTVEFEEPVDSFTFVVSSQVRLNSIVVNPN